ncbi:MAG: carboxypeptidase-like regulatory domain-containing protein [Flavobacteriaceae bacterium]|nr:carboxypeptidase-like regulatory domain-containing protein [Flavobacteriaceae bacterium]
MQTNRLWLLLLLVNFYISAQTKGVVVDEQGKPIPYVNIWVENENIGTTSEENGEFSIAASANKNLIFSILGFEKRVLKASEASNVIMKAVSFQLDEVVVARHFETKKIEIGTINNSVLEAFDNGPRIDVKFFPYEAAYKKTKFIKKVSILTDSRIDNATVKIHFYKADANGFPGEELLTKDYIVTIQKGVVRNGFDLTDVNLKMPKTGLFIGFEKLLISKNKLEKTIVNSNTQKTSIQVIYYPLVLYNYIERDFLYNFSGGKWYKQTNDKSLGSSSKIKAYEPAINLVLTN